MPLIGVPPCDASWIAEYKKRRAPLAGNAGKGVRMSIRIINAQGTPGTLACFGRTVHQRRPVFLTSCHVLYAAGAKRRDPVWLASPGGGYRRLGTALQGKRGIVRYRGGDCFVDCAIGALELPVDVDWSPAPHTQVAPKAGDRVWKAGAATGVTVGIVVDACHACTTAAGSLDTLDTPQPILAPGQLLVRSGDPRLAFAADGDSGALLWNDDNVPIGLLWGTTVAAEGVACPIDTVLHALNIDLCGGHA